MKLGQAIKKIIGELLFPLGYKLNYEGIWLFTRMVTNSYNEEIKQTIMIQKSDYGKALYLEIETTAYGRTSTRMPCFVPNCSRQSVGYADEESMMETISFLARVLEEFGLKEIDKMIEPTTNDRFLKADYMNALENHQTIAENFIQKNNIFPKMTLEESAEFVYNRIQAIKEKSFQEVKSELMDLGIFFAYQLEEVYGAGWYYTGRATGIDYYGKRNQRMVFFPFDNMKSCWLAKDKVTAMKILKRQIL